MLIYYNWPKLKLQFNYNTLLSGTILKTNLFLFNLKKHFI